MAQQTPAQRIRSRYSSRMWIALAVVAIAYIVPVMLFITSLLDGGLSWERARSQIDNLGTELIGAAVTFLIFQFILERRDHERDMLRALRQMRSLANDTVLGAVEELREEGFMFDGSLQGADLYGANLQGADLRHTNLQGTDLESANLEGTRLVYANLQGADLKYANLQGADLRYADLQGVYLRRTNLQDADLLRANLQGAKMMNANLQGANLGGANLQGAKMMNANLQGASLLLANLQSADLREATFDETTELPDDDPNGERSYWAANTDMARFTDPDYSDPENPDPKKRDFWRTDRPDSPAYRGNATDRSRNNSEGIVQIEFASIKSSRELCERLENELPLGKTNISEVQDFLSRRGLVHSDILIRSEHEPSMISRLAKEPYDSYIQCRADAPNEHLLWIYPITFSWYIKFLFLEGNLVEIIAQRIDNSPL